MTVAAPSLGERNAKTHEVGKPSSSLLETDQLEVVSSRTILETLLNTLGESDLRFVVAMLLPPT